MFRNQALFISLIGFIILPCFANCQVYDGVIDSKVFVGFAEVGDSPAIELKWEDGLSDYISYGWCVMYLLNNTKPLGENYDITDRFIERAEFGLCFNGHFLYLLNSCCNLDCYAGAYLSFKSLGFQSGIKYNFGERIGIYSQAFKSLSTSAFQNDTRIPNRYGKRFIFSVGITYNLN